VLPSKPDFVQFAKPEIFCILGAMRSVLKPSLPRKKSLISSSLVYGMMRPKPLIYSNLALCHFDRSGLAGANNQLNFSAYSNCVAKTRLLWFCDAA
jgi:hypothetical protein